jgi:hypothetical protein
MLGGGQSSRRAAIPHLLVACQRGQARRVHHPCTSPALCRSESTRYWWRHLQHRGWCPGCPRTMLSMPFQTKWHVLRCASCTPSCCFYFASRSKFACSFRNFSQCPKLDKFLSICLGRSSVNFVIFFNVIKVTQCWGGGGGADVALAPISLHLCLRTELLATLARQGWYYRGWFLGFYSCRQTAACNLS